MSLKISLLHFLFQEELNKTKIKNLKTKEDQFSKDSSKSS